MDHETVRPITPGQLKDMAATLIGAIPELSFEDAKFISGEKGVLVQHIKKAFLRTLKLKSPNFVIRIMDDLETAISAGAYDYIYDEIINARNFPMADIKRETVEVRIFSFGEKISTDSAVTRMGEEGFTPGKIEHLLAFEAENPYAAQFITALGSSCHHLVINKKVYPAIWTVTRWRRELRKDVTERTLGWQETFPGSFGSDVSCWNKDHVFLGFRQIGK